VTGRIESESSDPDWV